MGRGPSLATADLLDRYLVADGTVLLTGVQALVRLVLDQSRADRAAGLDTGGFVTGYPGSPLAGLDLELARRRPTLESFGVVHRPGLNEELAATAVAGSQLSMLQPDHVKDGVFAMWYGKAPGLDRGSDALRHGNLMGAGADGRGAGLRGRRPAGPVVERAVDVGADPLLARHADTEPGRPPGDPRPRAPRLRDVASLGPLGRGAVLGVGRRRRPERRRRPGPRRAAAPGPRGRRPSLRAPGERPAAGRDAARARGHALRQPHRGRAAPTAS